MTASGASTSRDEILALIETAIGESRQPLEIPRHYLTADAPGVDPLDRFAERVADYRANVHRTTDADLPATVAGALGARGSRSIVVPDGVPGAWVDAHRFDVFGDDPPLTHEQLDAIDAVITGCAVAIAETGTIVLDAGVAQGRRILTLLPDHHVCVVRADQIVGDVPQALRVLDPRRPLTWISGPSATSDIELDRVEGVHGPRKLDVVIVEPA